jgi:diguanylate cyclase (GGDEF)-like protein/PAS domain S-box-containing protein
MPSERWDCTGWFSIAPGKTVTPLSILLIEDSENDAVLIAAQTQIEGREIRFRRVETEAELRHTLRNDGCDAVLCDYVLPSFSGLAALKIVQQHDPDLPFLIVSGAIGEETAVEAMRAGAGDYIMKGHLSRLAPALERELREAEERRERRLVEVERERLLVADRQARLQIEKSADQTARLLALTTALSTAVTPEDVARAVVDHSAASVGANGCSVVVLSSDGSSLKPLCMVGYPQVTVDFYQDLPIDENIDLAAVVRTGEAAWISSRAARARPRTTRDAAYPSGGAAILPLLVQGQPIGGIEFIFRHQRNFAEDDRAFIVVLAQLCAQALYRASLYESVRQSEGRFRLQAHLLDAVGQAVVATTLDGDITYWNDGADRLFHYSADQVMGRNVVDVLPTTESVDESRRKLYRLASGEENVNELLIRRQDGTAVPVLSYRTPIRDATGTLTGIIGVSSDISAIKEVERELRDSEQRYRALFDTSPDGIVLMDMNGLIVTANRQLGLMLGCDSPDELAGARMEEYLPQTDRKLALEVLEQRANGMPSTNPNTRYSVLRRDGSTFPADVSSFVTVGASADASFITSTVRDATERVAYETQLQYLALHDPLTGLGNRTLLYDRLQQVLAAARRNAQQFAILLLDLDRFKDINDTFGHHVGDDIIREVGDRLSTVLRLSDSLARMGGDEYVILLPNTDSAGAVLTASRINAVLEQPIEVRGQRVHVGSSIGIAVYPEHTEEPDVLLRHADLAMYSAKQANIGHAVYAGESDSHGLNRLALSGQLRDAIQTGQLVLHYQPKMRLDSGEIDGVEALVRWNHPQYGLISPDQFIPLAEHSGLIRPLTSWVLDKALTQCREWQDLNLDVGVAVNLSTRSLYDPDLPIVIDRLLASSGASASHLTVEITESVIMANPEHAMDVLGQLIDFGIKLSIDDFGTGYSSLSYLRHLRANELKIDRSFVMDLDSNDESNFIVRSVVELGHNLGLEVVAEGVESQRSLDILSALRCDRIQGYCLSWPQTAADLTRWMQERRDVRGLARDDPPDHVPVFAPIPAALDALSTVLKLSGATVPINALP